MLPLATGLVTRGIIHEQKARATRNAGHAKKFIAYEQSGEFNAEEYYVGEWREYRERYQELAAEVREIASQEANFWK